ncbi:unnamed protein product [Calypogeia fissa]
MMSSGANLLIEKLQRDLNCLFDPDRSARRRALERCHSGCCVAIWASLQLRSRTYSRYFAERFGDKIFMLATSEV